MGNLRANESLFGDRVGERPFLARAWVLGGERLAGPAWDWVVLSQTLIYPRLFSALTGS